MAGGESSTPVFALLGHGNEEPIPYEERIPVPEGVTVVLFTRPGEPLPVYQAEDIWRTMYYNPELFQNPVANKDKIKGETGTTFRIYESGAPLPAMVYYPEGSMEGYPIKYYPAGLYSSPFPFPSMEERSIKKTGGLERTNIEHLYSGEPNERFRALFETDLQESGSVSLYKLKQFHFPIQDILTRPGVYYLLNCRFVKGLKDRVNGFLTGAMRRIINGEDDDINEMKVRFRKELKEILDDGHTKPEDKLNTIRLYLQIGSRIPNINTIEEPLPNNELQRNLNNPEFEGGDHEYFEFLQLKRILLAEFENDFGALQRRLRLTRTLSNAHQMEHYGRGGSKRKRRKTRKNHSLNRKRRTHGK